MSRILAIDYGKKRCGLAVTDPLQIIAGGLACVETTALMAYIKDYVAKNDVEAIVMGLPTTVRGEFSDSYKYIEPFFKKLEAEFPAKKIIYYDERFTTKIALQSMIAGGVKKGDRNNKSGLVDKVSAALILQSYLASVQNR